MGVRGAVNELAVGWANVEGVEGGGTCCTGAGGAAVGAGGVVEPPGTGDTDRDDDDVPVPATGRRTGRLSFGGGCNLMLPAAVPAPPSAIEPVRAGFGGGT